MDSSWKGLCYVAVTFTFLPFIGMLNSFPVVRDTVSGHYYSQCRPAIKPLMPLEHLKEQGDDADADGDSCPSQVDATYEKLSIAPNGAPSVVTGPMSRLQELCLAVQIYMEYWTTATVIMFVYILPPETLAAWSLLRRGTAFEYIVAPKPE